jgi:hypothetical protein
MANRKNNNSDSEDSESESSYSVRSDSSDQADETEEHGKWDKLFANQWNIQLDGKLRVFLDRRDNLTMFQRGFEVEWQNVDTARFFPGGSGIDKLEFHEGIEFATSLSNNFSWERKIQRELKRRATLPTGLRRSARLAGLDAPACPNVLLPKVKKPRWYMPILSPPSTNYTDSTSFYIPTSPSFCASPCYSSSTSSTSSSSPPSSPTHSNSSYSTPWKA